MQAAKLVFLLFISNGGNMASAQEPEPPPPNEPDTPKPPPPLYCYHDKNKASSDGRVLVPNSFADCLQMDPPMVCFKFIKQTSWTENLFRTEFGCREDTGFGLSVSNHIYSYCSAKADGLTVECYCNTHLCNGDLLNYSNFGVFQVGGGPDNPGIAGIPFPVPGAAGEDTPQNGMIIISVAGIN